MKKIGCLFVFAAAFGVAYVINSCVSELKSASEVERAKLARMSPAEREAHDKAQREASRKLSIAIRLQELKDTNGGGRVRNDVDVENAARLLYNTWKAEQASKLIPIRK